MPSPVLQFKRGALSNVPGLRAGEPALTTDSYDLFVGIDSTTNNNKFFGSHRYWKKETSTVGSGINLVEGTANGSDHITLKSPDTLAGITTYTFPATPTNGYFLKTNASGTLSWDQVISDFYIAADSGSADTVSTGSTITFVGGTNVNTAVTDQTITINLDSGITLTNVNATGIVTAATLAGVTTVDATTKATLEAIIGSEPNTFSNLLVTGISTFNGNVIADSGLTVGGVLDANGGATIDNIQIGITNDNKIDTVAGVLQLDSAGGKVVIQDHTEIFGNLNVTGNVTVGGTSVAIIASDIFFGNKDIILGYSTATSPTDDSANHGGIAIASTEGTPLVSFSVSGINTLPDTYKQMMWFQSGTLGFQEDMFAFNYGVAIGTTVTPLGARLAVGTGITMSDTDIKATNFYGSLVGDASGADKVKTIDASNADTNYYLTFVDSNNGGATNETVFTDSSITYNASANKLTTQSAELGANLLVSGITTLSGNVTVSGIATFPTSNVYINNDLYVGGLQVTGGTSIGNLKVTGISTIGDASADTLTVNATTTFVEPIVGTIGTATKLQTPRSFEITGDIVASPISFDGSGNVSLAATIQPNSVALGTDTTGNYVTDVTAGEGLTKTSASGEGQTVDLRVVVGSGLTITSNNVAFKNASNLTDNKLLKWNASSTQLVNSILSDDGSTTTVAGSLVINNDLYVNGNTTQVNTTELTVNDRTITLGIATGITPTTTTWDLAVLMNYGDAGVAKTAGVIWDYSVERFVFSANSDNPASGYNTNTPVITVATHAPIEISSLWVNDCAGQSQVISCTGGERFLENITVDAGTF